MRIVIDSPEGRQEFDSPLAAVLCLLAALDTPTLSWLRRKRIHELQLERVGVVVTRPKGVSNDQ